MKAKEEEKRTRRGETGGGGRKKGGESIKEGNLRFCFLQGRSS